MLPAELIVKVGLGIAFAACLFFFARALGTPWQCALLVALLLGHTTNWLLNGHFFSLMRFVRPHYVEHRQFLAFPAEMRDRLAGKKSISAVALFGSLSRNEYTGYSDLDVRVVTKEGMLNHIGTSLLIVRERCLAFFQRFPIDIFMVSKTKGLEKLRADESPIILLDNEKFLKTRFSRTIRFEDLLASGS